MSSITVTSAPFGDFYIKIPGEPLAMAIIDKIIVDAVETNVPCLVDIISYGKLVYTAKGRLHEPRQIVGDLPTVTVGPVSPSKEASVTVVYTPVLLVDAVEKERRGYVSKIEYTYDDGKLLVSYMDDGEEEKALLKRR